MLKRGTVTAVRWVVLGVVGALGVSGCTSVTEAPSPEAFGEMQRVMAGQALVADGGTGGGTDGGTAPGGADAGTADGGTGGGGSGSLCSQFTLCNTDADCVGNPAGSTCTLCPACGKHCWGGQQQPCTSCICTYGPCAYDFDCPTGSTCNAGTCKDGTGATKPNRFQTACQTWVAGQQGCTNSQIIPVGSPINSQCPNVRLQQEGHSSSDQCDPFITTSFWLCAQGCSVTACNAGCQTFANQQQAEATFEACRDMLDQMGLPYDLTITANQAVSGCGRESHMTLSCFSGGPTTVTYGACDPNKNCYFTGGTSKCTQPDGKVVDQVCCAASGGDPKWVVGNTCPKPPCADLKNGGTCWGNVPGGQTTAACTNPDGTAGQVVCCKAGGAAGWVEQGTWKDACN